MKAQKKIVIFGLTVSSSWGNGHATLWRALLRSLTSRGHQAVFFERDVPYYASARDLHRGDGYDLVLYRDWADAVPLAESALADADVAIVTSYSKGRAWRADFSPRRAGLQSGTCRPARNVQPSD